MILYKTTMSKQDIIENEVDYSINPPPPPAQEGYIQGNIGYNVQNALH